MVHSIQKEDRGKGVPCAVVVQYYCNRVGIIGGGGAIQRMIGSFTKALKRTHIMCWLPVGGEGRFRSFTKNLRLTP